MATPEDVQKIRYELNDNSPGLYILDDSTIYYYLDKNGGSIAKASVDCARAILLRLSMDSKEQICDILSVKSHRTAEQYRLALTLWLKDPYLNPILSTVNVYAGNISKDDYASNEANADNIYVASPTSNVVNSTTDTSNPFSV